MLGMCATETDAVAESEGYYRQAVALARTLGDPLLLLRALHNLAAGVYLPRGQFDLALAADEEALAVGERHELHDWLHFPLITLAMNGQITGRRAQARAALARLERITAAVPGSGARAYHDLISAQLAMDEGDLSAADALLERSRRIVAEAGDPPLNIEVRLATARYQRLSGDPAVAWSWADDALALATRGGYKQWQGRCLCERGRASWLRGEMAAAEADLRAALALFDPLAAAFDAAYAALLLAALLRVRQSTEAEQVWADAARRIAAAGYTFLLEQERTLTFPLIAAHLRVADAEIAALSAGLLIELARVPPPPLHIVTLGRFEVRQGGRLIPASAWRQRRAGELFRLLLIQRGRSLARDRIIDALWPKRSAEAANAPFHQATSALRHALEPDLPDKFPSRYLEVEAGRVTLRLPPDSQVDFELFEQHIRQRNWPEAVALYAGELFPEDHYADWAAAPRERLAQHFVEAAMTLAAQSLAEDNPHAALAAARRALEVEPWQERAVLIGMRACLALGDRTGALRLYRDLERTLRQELGIAPERTLRELYEDLQQRE
ncbi:MAG: hypothetical protein N2439_08570 [Anaerolineae bacterium]|nr:hypothetical protein [Anaerolineae bacterium]